MRWYTEQTVFEQGLSSWIIKLLVHMENGNGSMERNPPLLVKKAKYQTSSKAKADGCLTVHLHCLVWAPSVATEAQPIRLGINAIIGALQRAKGKPLMKVNAQTGSYAFQFDSEDDRDAVIEVTTELLDKVQAKGKQPVAAANGSAASQLTGPYADIKRQLLDEDKDLRELFKQLVEGGVLTEAEFWQSRQGMLQSRRQVSADGGGSGPGQQRTGLASAMLPEVTRRDNGKMSLTLTAELQAQIFQEKVWVADAFRQLVPAVMDARAFWEQYVTSELARKAWPNFMPLSITPLDLEHQSEAEAAPNSPFLAEERRKQRAAGKEVVGEEDDIFARYRRATAADRGKRVPGVDPTVNLAADSFDSMGEGFGVGHSARMDSEVAEHVGRDNLSLMAEINRHGAVVLGNPGGKGNSGAGPSREDGQSPQGPPGWEQRASSGLEDLRAQQPQHWEHLRIKDPRSYFNTGKNSSRLDSTGTGPPSAALEVDHSLGGGTAALYHRLEKLCSSPLSPGFDGRTAELVLGEGNNAAASTSGAGGDGLDGSSGDPATDLPKPLLDLFRGEVLKGNELLRHLWACFPLSSASRRAKADNLRKALTELYDRVRNVKEASQGSQRALIVRLSKPLLQSLDAGLGRMDEEQEKQARSQRLAAS